MKYAIVDAANIFNKSKYVSMKFNDISEKVGMSLHITLNSINSIYEKHKVDHVVLVTEGRSWRKDFYKPYKANRAVKNSARTVREVEEDKLFFDAYNDLLEFLNKDTSVTVLHHPNLEGDDLISGWVNSHPNDEHVINSSDSDFYQLLSNTVTQYNALTDELHTINGIFDINGNRVLDRKTKELKVIPDPKWLLFEKCIRGDTGDNVFSAYPGVRTKGSKNKVGLLEAYSDMESKGFNWNTFMLNTWVDHEGVTHTVKEDYQRNMTLIDLNGQPHYIKDMINDVISNVTPKKSQMVGIKFLKFCGRYDLEKLSSNAEKIAKWLSKPYKDNT